MPLVEVKMLTGRTPAVKARLIARLTDAVAAIAKVDKSRVTVIIQDVDASNWAIGGHPLSEKKETN